MLGRLPFPPGLRRPVVILPLLLALLAAGVLFITLGTNGPSDGKKDQGASQRHKDNDEGASQRPEDKDKRSKDKDKGKDKPAPKLPGPGRALLQKGSAMYPRAIRLEHNGRDNGRVLVSTVTHPGGDALGDFQESTDDGARFHRAGTLADPKAAKGRGLCCATLYELPQRIGDMPAGTLLWAASFGQDEKDRRMSVRVFKSTDLARSWSYVSTVATASGTGGLWEPEFSVDAEGNLVCHYSDETDPAHSQKLVAARSEDGVSWSRPRDTVASTPHADRPGMSVVRRLPGGSYLMTYEICAPAGQFDCVTHYRTSSDGWNWGDPTHLGFRPETADGEYFKHAPTLAWAPEKGNPQGKLFLVGQAMYRADGSRAPDSGRVIWTNSKGGRGPWRKIPAPVSVKTTKLGPCPNYSSSLLPSSDGSQVLEVATDTVGGQCMPYVGARVL
ncbi:MULTISPECIES: exo-alpha-sialidase [unclassified Streptomyces]|uniref:exo-alpha-sialidase n=1 Tax=unclassified Streptomyces TaxID=2593676 RepID=UPI002DDB7F85|nr:MULTISPECIES: exo-alpha-sialidase [unclassified Streptomyces]WSB76143.1 exo-alpha-sialidase [Streptomyces sp. NBC_01775]WSS15583.1 exo-alpha-sialidase [Streptomyces sp. NBC_01186]WSS44424.1 exo-alpha-sialidase [Streptomyces sp. NBC_01187]